LKKFQNKQKPGNLRSKLKFESLRILCYLLPINIPYSLRRIVMNKIPVAILGSTGVVGQKMIAMLSDHPHFYVAEIVASDKNLNKSYGEVSTWFERTKIPSSVFQMRFKSTSEITSPYALSALPSEVAAEIEPNLASKGIHVISNASTFRMNKYVPLLIPEINPSHLEIVAQQKTTGKMVTNPNCSTVFLAMAIFPLYATYKIKHITAVTLQAISGAGYPGLPSLDILGDCIPNILGEEEKIQNEVKKILGSTSLPATFTTTVNVNRIPVKHGHTVIANVHFTENISKQEIEKLFITYAEKFPQAYQLHFDNFSPRPTRDLTDFDNRTHIGRIRVSEDPRQISLVAMGHNLVRGAAGAAILNLELFHKYLGK